MRPTWRGVALSLVAFGVLATVALLSAPALPDTSSRGASRSGTAALYRWFTSLGYPTHRFEGSFDLGGTDLVIISNPTRSLSGADSAAVYAYAQAGGHVLVATDSPIAVEPLLVRLGVGVDGRTSSLTATPLGDGLRSRVGTVALGGNSTVWQSSAGADVLLTTSAGPVAIRVPVGSGEVYLVGTGFPFDNDGLRRADDAQFALYLSERSRGGRVGFDDFHHQVAVEDGQKVILYSPLGLGLVIAVAAVLLWLASTGRRLGRAVPRRDPGRVPTATDYVNSMAQLFERSDDRGSVATRYAEAFKVRLSSVTGVDARLADDLFVAALTAFDPTRVESVAALLDRARHLASGHPADTALLTLALDMDAAEAAYTGASA